MFNENLCARHCYIGFKHIKLFNMHNRGLSAIIIPIFTEEEM